MAERWIMHVDMDAFYAAVEQRDRPELRGKPVIIGGLSQRGVVSTASYEARKFGVRSAMPITEAFRRCPQGVFLFPNHTHYVKVSMQIQEIFRDFSPSVEMLSVDEAFLDVSGMEKLYRSVAEMPWLLKERIRKETGLIASAGLAPNKFVAKIASDLGKPDGLLIVQPGEVLNFLAPLPLERIWGVGKKTAETLHDLGFSTIGDIQKASYKELQEHFDSFADRLYYLSRGEDDRLVEPDLVRKSLGKETTYEEDLMDSSEAERELLRLSQEVGWRLRREGFSGMTVMLKLRYAPFVTISRSHTFASPISLDEEIFEEVRSLFRKLDRKKDIRLLGVAVGNLEENSGQGSLFQDDEEATKRTETLDNLKRKFGEGIISRGGVITPRNAPEEPEK